VDDLRSMLEVLRANGLVVDVRREVNLDRELGAVLHAVERSGRTAFFHNVKGHQMPVVGGVLASHAHMALALDCERRDVRGRLAKALDNPIPAHETSVAAPAQEVAERDATVALTRLPVPIHAPLDAGPFINAGVVIARDPNSGFHNLSFNRMQVYDDRTTGLNVNAWRHIKEFFSKSEARGEDLPFCVAVGVDPALLMAAAFRYKGDEYEIAGGIRRRPIEVVRALSCDVLVPAHAELVLEGKVLAGQRRDEGPMAEFTGHYSGRDPQLVANICAISHRKAPLFETMAGASPEHLILGNAVTREGPLLDSVRRMSPRVSDVHLPTYGSGFLAVISMHEPHAGEAESVGIAALASHVNVKAVVIVDDDVNIYDPSEIMWALATRTMWERAPIRIPGALGNDLDPASDSQQLQGKAIVVAVLGEERRKRFTKVNYPDVELSEYISVEGA
jgi:2,5-furandicarboxylate decarboxylase 1